MALCTWIAGCASNAILGSRDSATDGSNMMGDGSDANMMGDGTMTGETGRDGDTPDDGVRDDGTGDDGTGDSGEVGPGDDGTGDAAETTPTDDGTGDAAETTPADDGMGDTGPSDDGTGDAAETTPPTDDGVMPDVQAMDAMDVATPTDDGVVPDTGADVGPDAACAMGQTLCGTNCTDVSVDPANCGMCGRACMGGQVCTAGACACPTGQTMCGGACVATSSDTANCGMCGNACVAGASCNMGACTCPMGQTLCGGACVDTTSSGTNCGACGTVCPTGQVCNGGMCRATCDPPRTTCTSGTTMVCTNLQDDENNCGMCGNRCPVGPGAILGNCLAGTCIAICGPGRANCDRNLVNGCEIDTAIDPNNCGGCGIQCTGGRVCLNGTCGCPTGNILCGGVCVNPNTDNNNCRTCGTTCGTAAGQTCIAGTCTCTGTGQIACGQQCFNGQTDNMHCGDCTTVCSGGQTCVTGTCRCPTGQIFCNGACVDPQTSAAHCNGCNMACTGGVAPDNRTCRGAMCLCPTGQSYCMAQDRCRNLQTDRNNCGTCGNVCPGAQVCVGGVCGLTCTAPTSVCGSGASMYCANLTNDNSNCGTCGTTCTGGRTCQGSMCLCPAGQTLCGGVCRTLTSDVNNCGACNNMCPAPGVNNVATSACVTPPAAGGCAITCNAGTGNCDSNLTNGCETNTNTSTSHCGMCGNACTTGQVCLGGTCQNPAGCSDGSREAFTNSTMYPNVAGCSGGFGVPGLHPAVATACGRMATSASANPSCSAEDLCATGWHVCRNQADFALHNPDGNCSGAGAPSNTFFATGQSSTGSNVCATGSLVDPTGCTGSAGNSSCSNDNPLVTNDFYGCGTLGTSVSCGSLNRASGNACGEITGVGWSCPGAAGLTESITVTHTTAAGGGVICCRD